MKVCVIGAGAAGVAAAWTLSKKHQVTLLEKNDDIGGHVHTVDIPAGPDAGTPVDTGFIVLNDRTYPTLHRLFKEWGVAVRDADMSFGYHCEATGLQYSGKSLDSLFAQRKNILSPRFWSMLFEIARFGVKGLSDLGAERAVELTLGQYLEKRGFTAGFIRNYIAPMGAAIWSTPSGEILDFPAETFLNFFRNHGLLALHDRPQWQTVPGGSKEYLKAFAKKFTGTVRSRAKVSGLRRPGAEVQVRLEGEKAPLSFDAAVVAVHADQALRLLEDPSPDELRLLSPFRYELNRTLLHSDTSLLPPNPKAWASWNYFRPKEDPGRVTLTYDMTNLQGLMGRERWLVTLNPIRDPKKSRIIKEIAYEHPLFSFAAIKAQKELPSLNGKRSTWFCGSYFGYGFHEDAVKSAVKAAESL